MRRHTELFALTLLALLAMMTLVLTGCQQGESVAANSSGNKAGKIAVTTSSEEARKEYLAGRDLQEKLRITDSIQHFDKAISLDPNFALAELNRANVSPTAKEFFDHLKKAVTLSEKASDGERMLIQATEAGANGNQTKQRETLERLVAT